MDLSRSRALAAAITMGVSLFAASQASGDAVKVEVAGTGTYFFFGGDAGAMTGEGGVCLAGEWYGGTGSSAGITPTIAGDTCATDPNTTTVTLPPDDGGATEPIQELIGGGGDGGGSVKVVIEPAGFFFFGTDGETGTLGFCTVDGEWVGGSGPPPAPGGQCPTESASVTVVVPPDEGGGGGGDSACKSSDGTDATCVDLDEGNYLVLESPEDGRGEFGLCTTSEEAPAGPGYYYVAGPNPEPGGDTGVDCPERGGEGDGGDGGDGGGDGGGSTPADSDGDGVPDSSDRCPTVAAATADGCPAESSGGSPEPTHEPQVQERPVEQAEPPRVAVRRRVLRVGRRGRLAVPIRCRSERTVCRGKLKLIRRHRTRRGVRRIVLARVAFRIEPRGAVKRRVRLTKAGRAVLRNRRRVRAVARTVVASDSGRVVTRQRVALRRRR